MTTYTVEYLSDDMDCETCGSSYAVGYRILKDGVELALLQPVAACYDGMTYDQEDAFNVILEDIDPTISVEWD